MVSSMSVTSSSPTKTMSGRAEVTRCIFRDGGHWVFTSSHTWEVSINNYVAIQVFLDGFYYGFYFMGLESAVMPPSTPSLL